MLSTHFGAIYKASKRSFSLGASPEYGLYHVYNKVEQIRPAKQRYEAPQVRAHTSQLPYAVTVLDGFLRQSKRKAQAPLPDGTPAALFKTETYSGTIWPKRPAVEEGEIYTNLQPLKLPFLPRMRKSKHYFISKKDLSLIQSIGKQAFFDKYRLW